MGFDDKSHSPEKWRVGIKVLHQAHNSQRKVLDEDLKEKGIEKRRMRSYKDNA